MSKSYHILVIVIVIALLFGCFGAGVPTDQTADKRSSSDGLQYPEKKVDELLKEYGANKEFDLGKIEETDNGIAYTLKGEKLTDTITLDRKIEYSLQKDGKYQGQIKLTFNGPSSETEYTFYNYIPKEFAADIDQVKFSIAPSKIINRDIETEHQLKFSKQMDLIVTAVENEDIDDVADKVILLAAEYNADKCFSIPKENYSEGQACMMKVINGFPERSRKFCDNLARTPKKGVKAQLCYAILEENPNRCDDMAVMDTKVMMPDIIQCKTYVFGFMKKTCEGYGDQTKRDDCFFAAAIKTRDVREACLEISNEDKYLMCLAFLEEEQYVKGKYCAKIISDELKKQCCDKILTDEEDRKNCMESGFTGSKEVIVESDCGFEGAKCCECYTCGTGLTCDTSTYDEKCVQCGANGQRPCDKCGGFNPLGTTCCYEKKEEVEPCKPGLKACSKEEGGSELCQSCGCYDQSCCNGKCGYGMTCFLDICTTSHDIRGSNMCESDSDCAKVRKCVEGSCMLKCNTDNDCSRFSSFACKGGVCRQK